MNLTEAPRKVDTIIDELFVSMKKDQVENIFSIYQIEDRTERIQLLRKCMQVLDTSDINETLTLDDEYGDELEIFIAGKWRFMS
jgi:hypothetical protein